MPICLESCGEGCPSDQRCEGSVCVPAQATGRAGEDAGGNGHAGSGDGRTGSDGDSGAAGSGGEGAGTGGDGGSSVDCGCLRGAFSPVCGTDGQTYDATCGRECVPVAIACDGQCPCNDGELRWYETCGDPVCAASPEPWDDPAVRNCSSSEEIGDPCTDEGALCDGAAICGASVICAASDPKLQAGGCPISRSRFKEDIAYLSDQQLQDYAAQLMTMPLASYRYKHASGAGPQLGFIIDDIEPSVAVSGDRVNMYGYLSMAVAAIQVQQKEIASLQRELERLRAQLPIETAPTCGP
jgi:hypothetical protein